jgi:hypothetical protein
MTNEGELLPQAFSASNLCVPAEIRLESGWISWRWGEYAGSAPGRAVTAEKLLDRFLKIETTEDAYQFAHAFGPLGICSHGNPICHANLPGGGLLYAPEQEEETGVEVVSPPSPESFYCPPTLLTDGWFGESVEWWLVLASATRAIENTATRLKRAERPLQEDLLTLHKMLVWGINPTPLDRQQIPKPKLAHDAKSWSGDGDALALIEGAPADGARSRAWTLVLLLLNEWLKACSVRLHFTFTDAVPHRVDFDMSFIAGDQRGCFPALVFELIGRVRAVEGKWMVRCTYCKVLVSPRQEPRGKRRVFCRTCRAEGWPARYALREYYARHRKEILASRKCKRRATKK